MNDAPAPPPGSPQPAPAPTPGVSPAPVSPTPVSPAPVSPAPEADGPSGLGGWLWPLIRVVVVVGAAFFAWYVAGHWDRWTGAVRYENTNDANMAGDLTPLAAKVSGYVSKVPVADYQTVHAGELLVEIEPSDYRAQMEQARANLIAAQLTLANIANQRAVQKALVRQADATIQATAADALRYHLEADRQHNLLHDRLAGTEQAVEQADDNDKRSQAQLALNSAQLDQQKALLAALDVQEEELRAQVRAAQAQLDLANNNLGYTRIVSPADGIAGQRQVRPGQFVNIGTQVVAVMPLPNIWAIANYKETQMTRIRIGQPARVTVDAFPDLVLHGHVDSWSPGTGSTFALLPPDNATGNFTKVVQRVPVKIVLDPDPALGTLVRPGMSVETTIDTGAGAPSGPTPATTEKPAH
jgi:membrane fusion protein, multidrug efflux system